jgi:hypothetical protein
LRLLELVDRRAKVPEDERGERPREEARPVEDLDAG